MLVPSTSTLQRLALRPSPRSLSWTDPHDPKQHGGGKDYEWPLLRTGISDERPCTCWNYGAGFRVDGYVYVYMMGCGWLVGFEVEGMGMCMTSLRRGGVWVSG